MKLSIHLAMEELSDWDFTGNPVDGPTDVCCSYPVILTPQQYPTDPEALYIVSAADLPRRAAVEESIRILCIGTPAEEWTSGPSNLVFTLSDQSPAQLMNDVIRVFHRYDKWERSLQEAVDQHLSINELGLRTLAVLNNPIYAQNYNHQVIINAIPKSSEGNEKLEQYRRDYSYELGSFSDEETMSILMHYPEYKGIGSLSAPNLYENSSFGFRNLTHVVSFGEMSLARVCIDEVAEPLRLGDYCIIMTLGDFIAKAILQDADGLSKSSENRMALKELLDHNLLPESRIDSLLKNSTWNMDDEYVCVLLSLGENNEADAVMEALSSRIAADLKTSWYTIYGKYIVIICNLSYLDITHFELSQKVAPLARDNLLTVGYSTVFEDFKNLYYYYRQARATLAIGMRDEPTRWSYQASDYFLDFYLAQCLRGMTLGALIPPSLAALIKHDEAKNTDYVTLLKTYLDQNGSLINTARALYMGRSTVIYQLARIKEICGIDIDEAKNRLVLRLALYILEQYVSEEK